MIYKSLPVNIACAAMILAAIVLSPVYGLWLLGGMMVDRIGQARRRPVNSTTISASNCEIGDNDRG